MWVDGGETNTLLHMPGAEPLQGFEKVIGEGDGTVRRRMGVGGLARFREEDDIALLPEAGVYWR